MIVSRLIKLLGEFNPDAIVRLAQQPSWPFEYSVGKIASIEDKDGDEIVYIGEGSQLAYLDSHAAYELGWSENNPDEEGDEE